MRITDLKDLTSAENELNTSAWDALSPVSHRSYHELADRPVLEIDALTQLETNVQMLESLQGRLAFVMREVGSLLKV